MNEILDELSPDTIGEDRIGITVDQSSQPLLVSKIITLRFDYSRCYPEGVALPLRLQVQPAFGDGTGYFQLDFLLQLPRSYAFTVQGAGQYLVLLKELGHNFWQGRMLMDVGGDKFTQIKVARS